MSASTMNSAIGSLRSNVTSATAEISSSWSFFGSGASKDAALYALQTVQKAITQLDGPMRDRVMAGTYSLNSWLAFAAEQHRTIRTVWADAGEWTFTGVVTAAASASVEDGKALASKAAETSKFYLPMVAVALVALLLLRVL